MAPSVELTRGRSWQADTLGPRPVKRRAELARRIHRQSVGCEGSRGQSSLRRRSPDSTDPRPLEPHGLRSGRVLAERRDVEGGTRWKGGHPPWRSLRPFDRGEGLET